MATHLDPILSFAGQHTKFIKGIVYIYKGKIIPVQAHYRSRRDPGS
jgi:hypothetical protein